ncbi:MAG: hypothetical protein M3Z35_07275 [Nitrospirota bacterium]|nr:hypothetical protein [Nitrospirota bacterium]
MPAGEVFVPARITKIETIDPGEIRLVVLTLPEAYDIGGGIYFIRDAMCPGNAFLAKPIGARTEKSRRRMYTRSNASLNSPRVLETIINHTHEARSDTSIWWQTDEVEELCRGRGTVDVRLNFNSDGTHLDVFENSPHAEEKNLRLELDDQWPTMRYVAIALSTGITPFLAYLDYMQARDFGRTHHPPGCRFTLVACVRHQRQLMQHETLLDLARRFPDNFQYYPVLTREWPPEWPYGKGRMIRASETCEGSRHIDLTHLLEIVPDLDQCHLRMCGNALCRDEIVQGLQQHSIEVLSFRSEVW